MVGDEIKPSENRVMSWRANRPCGASLRIDARRDFAPPSIHLGRSPDADLILTD